MGVLGGILRTKTLRGVDKPNKEGHFQEQIENPEGAKFQPESLANFQFPSASNCTVTSSRRWRWLEWTPGGGTHVVVFSMRLRLGF